MNRRDLLTKSAAAAVGAVALPKILDAVCSQSPTGGKVPNATGCQTSCIQLGMRGIFPNCYFPQYMNLNVTLASQVQSARLGAYWAVMNRTVTQSQWNNLKSLHSQWSAHLAVTATQIWECMRQQWIGGSISEGVVSGQINYVQEISNDLGLDPNIAANMTYNGMPQADIQTQALHDQIMNLPNYQGLDNLSVWSDAVVASVSVPQTGQPVCSILGGSQALMDSGNDQMAIGGLLGLYGASTGPAAPLVAAVATATFVSGFMFYGLAKICQDQE